MTQDDNHPSDDALWRQLTGEAKKLDSPARVRSKKAAKAPATPRERVAPPPMMGGRERNELNTGDLSQVDGATAERFRKGKYPVDRTVDLHGLTRDQAYTRLLSAVQSGFTQGQRCLLVITGKGKDKDPSGVLKNELPRWVNAPDIQPYVLAFTPAQPGDGGSGAYYLLLKRQR